MTSLLLLGGGGFLGHHIRDELNNHNIRYLSPRSSELNLLDYNALLSYLAKYKPTTIVDAAALCGGITKNATNPATFLRDNTLMGLNIYEAARLNNITNIYSLGSVCMYGDNCPTPFKEDNMWEGGQPQITNSYYSQGKRTLMMLGTAYKQQYGFTGAHLIPTNLFGPHDSFDMTKSHVIPALIKKTIDAKETNAPYIECLGKGVAHREFLYAGDCAVAIVKAVRNKLDTDLPINLGTGKSISIADLAVLIKELCGYEGDVVFKGGFDGQMNRRLDVTRAKNLLNWESKTSLRDGLKATIAWYIDNRHETKTSPNNSCSSDDRSDNDARFSASTD